MGNKVLLVVRVLNEYGEIINGYVSHPNFNVGFIPPIGMKFKGGSSTWLWETRNGDELTPAVKEIVYNIDEEVTYCLFEIKNESLVNSFWHRISNLDNSFELSQFEPRKY